jgi:glycosyltransferase 2 family protein
MKRWLAWLGATISLLILLLVFSHVNLEAAAENVRRLGWGHWLIGSLVYLTSFFPRGLRWKLMLPESRRLPTGWVTKAVVIGYAANNLLPFRLGEVVRSYIVGKRFNLSKLTCLATVGAEKVLDGCCLLGMLAGSLPFITIASNSTGNLNRMFLLVAALFGGAIAGCFALAFWDRQLVPLAGKWLPQPAARIIRAGVDALTIFRQGKTFFAVVCLTILVWFLEAACFIYFLHQMGIAGAWSKGIFCLAIVNFSILVPSAPGYVGVFQAGTVAAFMAMGHDLSTGLAFGVVTHAAQFFPTTLIGVALASLMGLNWRQLYRLKNE